MRSANGQANSSPSAVKLLILSTPDSVTYSYTRVTGTHAGELFGIASTGRRIDVKQMQIESMREGCICQHWRLTGELALLRQLGQV